MKFAEFIPVFTEKAKELIAWLEEYKTLDGEAKKKRLDADLLEWCLKTFEKVKMNAIVKLIIKKGIEAYLPVITQAIFDLIKSRVKGVTGA